MSAPPISAAVLKEAGISYIKYANICAAALRRSLKDDLATKAKLRNTATVKISKWENAEKTSVGTHTMLHAGIYLWLSTIFFFVQSSLSSSFRLNTKSEKPFLSPAIF